MSAEKDNSSSESATPSVAKATGKPSRSGGGLRLLIVLAAGMLIGRLACAPVASPSPAAVGEAPAAAEVATVWTCSMHPQIRQDAPGQCPICGMELIPLVEDSDEGLAPSELAMTENAMALANILTAPVERRSVSHEVRLVGKVAYDETLVSYITAWVPSRLDRMFVDYTGVTVHKGDHMAEVYSPDLIATQQELLAAVEAERQLNENGGGVLAVVERQESSVQAARDRLRLWGLSNEQIDAISEGGVIQEHVTINSPVSGVVIHKNALQGDQVGTGARIYTIADLSRLWVQLDAYESDLSWLHYGQRVQFTTEAWPGEVMEARISFIDPVLDDSSRTIKVRLNVDNADGRLKPDMFVHAVIDAPMTAQGQLVDAELEGMFMCPMHPEIVAAEPGQCDVCGMDLVSVEELGFRPRKAQALPLVIPATAPLITGKRAVVYVRVPGTSRPTFEGRQIVLGPRAGDWYVVAEGLAEGEQVVVNGAFKIDSELQIRAKPSMMNPASEEASSDSHQGTGALAVPPRFAAEVSGLMPPYLALHDALAADDVEAARRSGDELKDAFDGVGMAGLEGASHMAWMDIHGRLVAVLETLQGGAGLDELRPAFAEISEALVDAFETFALEADDNPLGVFHCPMALGEGALWIDRGPDVRNPYLGTKMPSCGDRLRGLGEEH